MSPSHPAPRLGRTPSGEEFLVPSTVDMFQVFLNPRSWGPAELLTYTLSLLTLLSLLLRPVLPPLFYISIFFFWRLSYNLGLALLLRAQSNRGSLTRWIESRSPAAQSLLNWACAGSVPAPYHWGRQPAAFNAWVSFRALCTLILANDGLSYFVICVACNQPFRDASAASLAFCVPAGVALLALSFWSKAKAHHALGDFAWYWGDFFFTIDGELVFDGVFELFPHPMYTVGYSGYYGSALITRSYTVLLVSLLAHLAQLAFLALVEEPHIRKIYGAPAPANDTCEAKKASVAATPSEVSEHDLFLSTVPQPAVFAALSMLLATVIVMYAPAVVSTPLTIALLLFWRVTHWAGCAVLLQRDEGETDNLWMRWCLARGCTRTQAYSSWQHVFLFSYLMNHSLFVIAVLSLPGGSESAVGSYSLVKQSALGLSGFSLMAVAFVSMISAWSVTGYFGFFYGDFFVAPESRELTYSGSFRYVTNPESSLGYLAYYGLAIVRQSRSLFFLAFVCQCLHMLFISCVEDVNVEREYKLVRQRTALEKSIASLPGVAIVVSFLRSMGIRVVRAIQERIDGQFESVSKKMAVQKEKMKADIDKAGTKIWEQHVQRRATELKTKAESRFGVLDCDKVISLLEKRGVAVKPVAEVR